MSTCERAGGTESTGAQPCGPECRFASELPAYPDYAWCRLRCAPQRIEAGRECAFFATRSRGTAADAAPPAAVPVLSLFSFPLFA
jgi:hypothetical protein